MKKLTLLVGGAIGFVLGSRAGREPYQRLDAKVRHLAGRPEVQQTVEKAKAAAQDQTAAVTQKVKEKLPTSGDASSQAAGPATPAETYADPQDLQFGAAAAQKEERLDAMVDQGISGAEIAETEDHLLESEGEVTPRAGDKAEPGGEH